MDDSVLFIECIKVSSIIRLHLTWSNPHLVYPHYVYYFDKVPHFIYSAIDTVPHLVYFQFVYIWSITYSKQQELSYIYLHI